MIKTISEEELVLSSDLIAICRVEDVRELSHKYRGARVISTTLQISQVLKGVQQQNSIVIETLDGLEDEPQMVLGGQYLLFFIEENGVITINNAIQGCWPVDNHGKTFGMGLGLSIDDIKSLIALPKDQQEN